MGAYYGSYMYTKGYLITDKNRYKSFALVYHINYHETGEAYWSVIRYCMLKKEFYNIVSQLDKTELSPQRDYAQ